jgi:S-adenosylmethionine hydrolase
MPPSIITLTTDFGRDSPYAAAMKGVILGVNPAAVLVDLTHEIPPQDLRATSYFLTATLRYFHREVIHVVVVDPGVGTERALLYVEVNQHRLLVPDNGSWTELSQEAAPRPKVIALAENQYWRPTVSRTFHGRDILAPVAGHLSLGLDPELLGKPLQKWVNFQLPVAQVGEDGVAGEVVSVDGFGNLVTNIPSQLLQRCPPDEFAVFVGGCLVRRFAATYGAVEPGVVMALVSSTGFLEIAVNQGSAARELHAGVGTPVALKPVRLA